MGDSHNPQILEPLLEGPYPVILSTLTAMKVTPRSLKDKTLILYRSAFMRIKKKDI